MSYWNYIRTAYSFFFRGLLVAIGDTSESVFFCAAAWANRRSLAWFSLPSWSKMAKWHENQHTV